MSGWNHPAFDAIRRKVDDEYTFLRDSIHVMQGEPCRKCKETRTYTYQKQVRAADEGFTTYTICFRCNFVHIE